MYDVVLLIEQEMSRVDAQQVTGLHEDVEDTVRYHVLMPVEDAAARLETSMGALAGHDFVSPMGGIGTEDVQRIQDEVSKAAQRAVTASIGLLTASGHEADGAITQHDPIAALAGAVSDRSAAEAIILTRPHIVQEFFHIDWTSRARRKIDVPTLHLLEHETFDEQAGGGEGNTGI